MIFAQEVRPGETAYMDEAGVTQFLIIDLNCPIMTLPGNEDKEMRITLPGHKNEVPKIYCLNTDAKEKDTIFDLLDKALHDDNETMKAKEKKIEKLEAKIESLYEDMCSMESYIASLERRVG